jgi:hypothetical protein
MTNIFTVVTYFSFLLGFTVLTDFDHQLELQYISNWGCLINISDELTVACQVDHGV